MLKGKKILIGITGSIAAYKSIILIRLLIKEGVEVKVIMTDAAKDFVSPLVLSVLSKNKVNIDFVEENSWANHVMLGIWADVFLIAPLSCNTLAKMASGVCDNLLLATYLSAKNKVVVAPAMDEDMWHHASVKRNISIIKSFGNDVIDVANGELASGLTGEGRMAEPETIVAYLKENYCRTDSLKGKTVLVTAGPTHEAIDPVRYISNHSSGKMGFAIAEAFYENGADVILITGPTQQQLNYQGIKRMDIVSGDDLLKATQEYFSNADIIVMNAAVADYKPRNVLQQKLKKTDSFLNLELVKTTDILAWLGSKKQDHQFLVGFALETDNEKENAKIKLKNKNLDCIVLNSLNDKNAGFGFDTNKVSILSKNGTELFIELKSKKEIAADIVAYILTKNNE